MHLMITPDSYQRALRALGAWWTVGESPISPERVALANVVAIGPFPWSPWWL